MIGVVGKTTTNDGQPQVEDNVRRLLIENNVEGT
jgi:hypothetical protein